MSKDIRSYFLPKGKKKEHDKPQDSIISHKKVSSKRAIIIDSDSDDEKTPSPKRPKPSTEKPKVKDKTKKHATELKPVNIVDIFGSNKVKRSEHKTSVVKKSVPQNKVKKNNSSFEDICSDSEFEATLRQLEELESAHTTNIEDKHFKSESKCNDSSSQAVETFVNIRDEKDRLDLGHGSSSNKNENSRKSSRVGSPKNTKEKSKDKTTSHSEHNSSDKHKKKENKTDNLETKAIVTPVKSVQKSDSENVKSPNVDLTEKKRQNTANYMKYLQREGPKHLGSKDIPSGKSGCFSGLVFVITGVLDSLEREQAVSIIQKYGGKVTSNVSRNTSYVVIGDGPGPAKVDKAIALGKPQIDEDGLLNLIVSKSNSLEDTTHTENNAKTERKHKTKSTPKHDVSTTKNKNQVENKSQEQTNNELAKSRASYENKIHVKNTIHDDVSTVSQGSKCPELVQKSVKDVAVSSLWVDKYRPLNTKNVIGQQGDRSVLKKLTVWLNRWYKNHSGNKKQPRPSPWAKNDDGAFFKAALLSGPPGVGKTTMAHLVSKELGFDIVEFNASDTRSKKLLHEEITELLSSKSLFGYFHDNEHAQSTSIKHVLIMDEVDGMAGNEDRGGMQELIQLIKSSHIPVICMCNDRNHPKIRSLVNYCFDLRVSKPRVEQIRGAMMSICFKEGLKISPEALNDIITGTNQDIRQILNHLSLWSAKSKNLSVEEAKQESEKAKKDMKLGPWDVIKKVFSATDHKTMSIHDKSDLFFHDYSLSPLFVQENYLSVVPAAAGGNKVKTLELVSQASDSISMGDLVDKCIRSKSAWNLLPVQAMYSSVIPGDIMEGYLNSQINFPAWLGKNSKRNKFDRLLQELSVHTRLSTSGSKESINLDYLTPIRDAIVQPLIKEGALGVPVSLTVLQEYHLLREDLEGLMELTLWPNQKDPMSQIEGKVKASLTRAFNKEGIMMPYSVSSAPKKRSATSSQDLDEIEGEEILEEEAEDNSDDITADAMIKAKKRPSSSKELNAGSSAPKRGRGRGKAKSK